MMFRISLTQLLTYISLFAGLLLCFSCLLIIAQFLFSSNALFQYVSICISSLFLVRFCPKNGLTHFLRIYSSEHTHIPSIRTFYLDATLKFPIHHYRHLQAANYAYGICPYHRLIPCLLLQDNTKYLRISL